MSSHQLPDREEIPIIDPGTISPPAATIPIQSIQESNKTISIILAIGFFLLIAIAVIVVFFLSDILEDQTSNNLGEEVNGRSAPTVETQKPAATNVSDRVLTPKTKEAGTGRADAEHALALYLEKKDSLERQAVPSWGGARYQQAVALEKSADGFFQRAEFDEAKRGYTQGVEVLSELEKSIPQRIKDAIVDGNQALEAGASERAYKSFDLALTLNPDNNHAQKGLSRSKINRQVFELLDKGQDLETKHQFQNALAKYRQAITLDPDLKRGQDLLAKINQKVSEDAFQKTMSRGFNLLNQANYSAALTAFQQAGKMKSGSPQVNEGLMQAREGIRLTKIEAHRLKALEFEKSENWQAATDQYTAVLKIDPSLQFAKQGQLTSVNNAAIHRQLDFYLKNPSRLYSKEPFQRAEQLLMSLENLPSKGRHLQGKIRELSQHLKKADTEYPVVINSDTHTDVAVFKIGKLGKFKSRKLMLRPGNYTAVGTRSGYRDVRHTFSVAGGKSEITVEIRCREKI